MSKLSKLRKNHEKELEFEQLKKACDECPNCDDYPPDVYRVPFTDGKFTCSICHAPINDLGDCDKFLHGIYAHKACMIAIALTGKRHPRKAKYEIAGKFRLDNYKIYGLRK